MILAVLLAMAASVVLSVLFMAHIGAPPPSAR